MSQSSPTLFDFLREEPAKPRRSFDRACSFKFLRQVRGKSGRWLFQARPWLPLPVGSVNLGLYVEERAAWDAVKRWIKAGGDPCRGLPDGVQPKWVRRIGAGRFAGVRRDRHGKRIVVGVFPTAAEAHAAARDWHAPPPLFPPVERPLRFQRDTPKKPVAPRPDQPTLFDATLADPGSGGQTPRRPRIAPPCGSYATGAWFVSVIDRGVQGARRSVG